MKHEQTPFMKHKACRLMAALLVAGGLTTIGYMLLPSMTSDAAAAGEGKKAQGRKPDANAKDPESPFDIHARQAAASTCHDVFTTLGSVMAAESAYRAATFWNQQAANKHAISSFAGLNFNTPDFRGAGAGIVYSAPVNGNCEGISVRIVPVPGKCSDFVGSLSSDVMQREDLNGVPLTMLKSGAKVMAIQAGADTCVAVTTLFANGALE